MEIIIDDIFRGPAGSQTGGGLLEVDLGIAQRIGLDGVSLTAAEVNSEGSLMITFSDERVIDAGKVRGDYGLSGFASPSTAPVDSPQAQMYVASGAGTYFNFPGEQGSPLVLTNNDSLALFFRSAGEEWWECREIVLDVTAYIRKGDLAIGKVRKLDPLAARKDLYIERISGQTISLPGINISDYIPIVPGHTYRIYTTDPSVAQLYDSYYTYASKSPVVYSRPAGSDTLLNETTFRAAQNENYLVVVTKLPNMADFSDVIALEDITSEKSKAGKVISIDYREKSMDIPDFGEYAKDNGVSYKGDSSLIGNKGLEIFGIINEAGEFVPETTDYTIKEFSRTLVPVNVDGYSHIRVVPRGEGMVPAYLSCYSSPGFLGFLGRTRGSAWSEIANYTEEGYVAELPEGTQYVSAVTYYHPAGVDTYDSTDIVAFNREDMRYYTGGYEIPVTRFKSHESVVRFSVGVNCRRADVSSGSMTAQDSPDMFDDWGVLMLPHSYSSTGKPVRLVIACHGAGGTVDGSQSLIENNDAFRYLAANGYAVMDMNGLPAEYASQLGVDIANNVGSPVAVQSYLKGYQWVVENYNIYTDGVLLCGTSMGALSSSNLLHSGSLNVLAHAMVCPVLDTYNQLWLNPWSEVITKTALARLYGFPDISIYDDQRVTGYNPILKGMFDSPSGELKFYPCRVKIWHCEDDPVANIISSVREVTAIRNGGGCAELRKLSSGGHEPFTAGEPLRVTAGERNYRNKSINVYPVAEELYLWFKRFS